MKEVCARLDRLQDDDTSALNEITKRELKPCREKLKPLEAIKAFFNTCSLTTLQCKDWTWERNRVERTGAADFKKHLNFFLLLKMEKDPNLYPTYNARDVYDVLQN